MPIQDIHKLAQHLNTHSFTDSFEVEENEYITTETEGEEPTTLEPYRWLAYYHEFIIETLFNEVLDNKSS